MLPRPFYILAGILFVALHDVSPVTAFKTRPDTQALTNNLGELKDTIRKQQETIRKQTHEIEDLKQLSSPAKQAATGGHGGHGAIADLDAAHVANYKHQPFYQLSLERVGWLGIFLASLSFTAVIMNKYEHTLEKHIELAYFVPLLAGHGGNTGGQSVGTVLSALSASTIQLSDAPQVIWKEAMSGVLSGLILGIAVAPIAYQVLGVSFHVATVLFFTLPMVATIAALLGALIPFVCVFLKLDPSVIAAPAMTSIVDIAGLMSYFMIANYIFKMVGLEL